MQKVAVGSDLQSYSTGRMCSRCGVIGHRRSACMATEPSLPPGLLGRRFGELEVVRPSPGARHPEVIVRCDCGVERSVRISSLVHGSIASCGRASHLDRQARIDGESHIGQKFGRLTVIAGSEVRSARGVATVRVKCECGDHRMVDLRAMIRGDHRSCNGPAHVADVIMAPVVKRWKWSTKQAATYVIEALGTGMIKIGRARDIEERLADLQVGCPVQLAVIATNENDIEKRLHSELAEHRSHGEWFAKNESTMRVISELMTNTYVVKELSKTGRPSGRKHQCKRCGEYGHHAKTCSVALAV